MSWCTELRIAVVSDVIYPWNKGGGEKRYYEVYRRLARRHEVHYFTMRYPGMKRKFMFENMTVHAIARASPDLYTHSHRKIAPAIRFSILLFFSLMKYRFDVIDSNEFPHFPNFAVKLYTLLFPQTVFFSTWHEQWSFHYWTTYLGFVGGMVGYVLQILSAKMPSLIIAVSEHTRTDLVRFGAIKEDRLRVISNGIDYESIKAAISDYRPQKGTMVFVGRLIPEKRIDLLIELFRCMKRTDPSLKLKIVGGGPDLAELQARANDDSIEFTGFIQSHQDVLRHVVGASVFVSMSEREGFNISALESCEMGVPTYVRLVCFKHPNLFELTAESIKDIPQRLQEPSYPVKDLTKRYSWDVISETLEFLFLKHLPANG